MKNRWTLDKPMASVSTCLSILPWMAILLNLYGTALLEQLMNIARFVKMWMFLPVCVSAYVCVPFSQVELALQM